MSAFTLSWRTAAVRLVAAPGAVFLAVLTAGLAASSTARHTGLFTTSMGSGQRPSVVLACPRTRTASAAKVAAPATASAQCRRPASQATTARAARKSGTVEALNESPQAEKRAEGKFAGSASASIPLPDFSTPELSRFTSPL